MSDHPKRTLILLATYNGGKYLRAQLDSFLAQTNDQWDLLVSDDGSSDDTLEILTGFKAQVSGRHEVTLLPGPQKGCAQNFLSLIRHVPEGTGFLMFSDQDDVWLPEKIARAQAALAREGSTHQPVLYAAGSLVSNESLTQSVKSPALRRAPSFGNALVQSIGGGNTMMLNGAATALLRAAAEDVDTIVVHDWWAYQMISGCGGKVIREQSHLLYYRQHGGNVIGANSSIRGKLYRLAFVAGRQFAQWNDTNIKALTASSHRLTPEAREALFQYGEARKGGVLHRLRALWKSGAARQTWKGTVALYLACIARKL
ncbi:UDP-Glc:alpha-D-GlcNAc-diphosphoundecaprenol beta-1,3-glucosyltransferase WfgD [Aliiroseovarius sp. xm-m-379]|uniref:glycosyltransferase n=1 Tax=unclassified Aliiroseovarius TaxID=2623558 RepID=UPI0015695A82|nr:UDP-Glc:alpha-D-GlcNAc-diphosphoundecaprenol beta-1,3-glucosyltransferase WfgD [Aliiroseovarius sp. xm-m-379]NRP32193.1 UDP-Glc:alpha-D-GlcNAc-diphosphoundecaprenol beta-1,3-glucosyltransferase WfgD [Aliiroseovarius sp. xm-a-104]NRP44084.1 UDP-Glc:alpha-D-GlcNAc-diphosphoundecaprenol beta-1,3-glucosyltransferase WfgD [Aliiroseovarius sp. xm-m-378]NRP48614.1 UDP-Glc:alpha-D-GlcNAc-diphosphoundecaprenol beta-1,3-glucosyltransferase WfgD [Aliiroseovarius sp. xm-m-354]NRP64955.1 UDP-Glc:alpha-D-